jgi:hypothetical protein
MSSESRVLYPDDDMVGSQFQIPTAVPSEDSDDDDPWGVLTFTEE